MYTSCFTEARGLSWHRKNGTGIIASSPGAPGPAPTIGGDLPLIAPSVAYAYTPYWEGWVAAGIITAASLVCMF
jgi:hypothetical protein